MPRLLAVWSIQPRRIKRNLADNGHFPTAKPLALLCINNYGILSHEQTTKHQPRSFYDGTESDTDGRNGRDEGPFCESLFRPERKGSFRCGSRRDHHRVQPLPYGAWDAFWRTYCEPRPVRQGETMKKAYRAHYEGTITEPVSCTDMAQVRAQIRAWAKEGEVSIKVATARTTILTEKEYQESLVY